MAFNIDPDGSVKNITIAQTSGNDILDQAAVACAGQWAYRPALENGKPIEVPWKARIAFTLVDLPTITEILASADITLPDLRNPQLSCRPPTPDSASPPAHGTAVLNLRIATDGSVKDITFFQSSGDGAVDQYLKTCGTGWRFSPGTFKGEPFEITWPARVS